MGPRASLTAWPSFAAGGLPAGLGLVSQAQPGPGSWALPARFGGGLASREVPRLPHVHLLAGTMK